MPSVILFRPIYDPALRSTPAFPWALLYVASVLVKRGVDVTVVDEASAPLSEDRLAQLFREKKPVAVGISSMTGDQIRFGLAFAERAKRLSDAAIVWGGIHPSLLPEQTVRHPLVDYVVAGEGEYAFADLVECLTARRDPGGIPGVYMKRNGEIVGTRQQKVLDLAALPEIPFDLVDVERYITKRPELGIERYFEVCTSRGCPHHCGFCYIESVHGSQWRSLNADQAAERAKAMVARFHLDGILFREDNFFVNRARVEGIARRLIEDNVRVKWAASCRINYFARYTREFVDLLRRSGCVLLTFGVESGSDRVLDFVGKGINVQMVYETAGKLKRAGIRGTYHFMGGFPSETVEELLETCRLIDSLMKIDPEIVVREMSIFAPYPGINLIPACIERGYRSPRRLEEWIDMDWSNPVRPWLTERQSRLISDVQFLIARLAHPHPAVRFWTRHRWNQMLRSRNGIRLFERPTIDFIRRRLRRP